MKTDEPKPSRKAPLKLARRKVLAADTVRTIANYEIANLFSEIRDDKGLDFDATLDCILSGVLQSMVELSAVAGVDIEAVLKHVRAYSAAVDADQLETGLALQVAAMEEAYNDKD